MATYTGDKEWRVEDVPPNDDTPLAGVWVRAWRGGRVVDNGPSWRFGTPEEEAAARDDATALMHRRNNEEAKVAATAKRGR